MYIYKHIHSVYILCSNFKCHCFNVQVFLWVFRYCCVDVTAAVTVSQYGDSTNTNNPTAITQLQLEATPVCVFNDLCRVEKCLSQSESK